jgi:hypothetical protein
MNNKNTGKLLKIRNSLKKNTTVIWDKSCQDRYMVIPNNKLFGREIYNLEDSKKSICKDISSSFLVEYNNNNNFKDIDYSKSIVLKIFNGTFIKMYYWKNKWNYSTGKSIYCKNSVWKTDKTYSGCKKINNKNFFDIFKNCLNNISDNLLEEYEKQLSKKETHIFLLYSPDCINTVPFSKFEVCDHILSISHIDKNKITFLNSIYEMENPNKELVDNFYNNEEKFSSLLIMGKDKNIIFKNKNYEIKSKLISNIPSLDYIILKNINNKKIFLKHFPFWEKCFKDIENKINSLSFSIMKIYTEIFKKKNKKVYNHKYSGISNIIHESFLENKNILNKENVIYIIKNKVSTGVLAKLMNIKIQL